MKKEKKVQDYRDAILPLLKESRSRKVVEDLLRLAASMETENTEPPPPPPPPPPEQRPKPDGNGEVIKIEVSRLMGTPGSELSYTNTKQLISELVEHVEWLEKKNLRG